MVFVAEPESGNVRRELWEVAGESRQRRMNEENRMGSVQQNDGLDHLVRAREGISLVVPFRCG